MPVPESVKKALREQRRFSKAFALQGVRSPRRAFGRGGSAAAGRRGRTERAEGEGDILPTLEQTPRGLVQFDFPEPLSFVDVPPAQADLQRRPPTTDELFELESRGELFDPETGQPRAPLTREFIQQRGRRPFEPVGEFTGGVTEEFGQLGRFLGTQFDPRTLGDRLTATPEERDRFIAEQQDILRGDDPQTNAEFFGRIAGSFLTLAGSEPSTAGESPELFGSPEFGTGLEAAGVFPFFPGRVPRAPRVRPPRGPIDSKIKAVQATGNQLNPDVIEGIIRNQDAMNAAAPGSINTTFLPALKELGQHMDEVVTANDPITRTAIGRTGINPSVLADRPVDKAIIGHFRQVLEADLQTDVALRAKVDIHAGRFSRSLNRAIGMDRRGIIRGTNKNWYDVFEQEINNPGRFPGLPQNTKNLINDVADLLSDLNYLRTWYGLRPIGTDDAFILPRQVTSINDIRVLRPTKPELGRVFEEATEGMEHGVEYSTDIRESLRTTIKGTYKDIAHAQLNDILEPHSITPSELIPANIINRALDASDNLRRVRGEIRQERLGVIRRRQQIASEIESLRREIVATQGRLRASVVDLRAEERALRQRQKAITDIDLTRARGAFDTAVSDLRAQVERLRGELKAKEQLVRLRGRGDVSLPPVASRPAFQLTKKQFENRVTEQRLPIEDAERFHELAVERALVEGEFVPENVLNQFPQLKARFPEIPETRRPLTGREEALTDLRQQINTKLDEIDSLTESRPQLLQQAREGAREPQSVRLPRLMDRIETLQDSLERQQDDLVALRDQAKTLPRIRSANANLSPLSKQLQKRLDDAHKEWNKAKDRYKLELRRKQSIAEVTDAELKEKSEFLRSLANIAEANGETDRALGLRNRARVLEMFGRGLFNKKGAISAQEWNKRIYAGVDAKALEEGIDSFQRPGRVGQFVRTLVDTKRLLMSVGDFAEPFIQGQLTLFRRPDVWAKQTVRHYQAFFDPQVQQRYVRDNIDTIQEMARYGITAGDTEFFRALNPGEGLSPGRALTVLPRGQEMRDISQFVGRQSFGRFQASYNTGLLVMRSEMWKAMRPSWGGDLNGLGSYINNLTGSLNPRTLGVSISQSNVEAMWMAFAPRLFRSTVALTADALRGFAGAPVGRATPQQIASLRALGSWMVGVHGLYVLVGMALGKPWSEIKDGLNPINEPLEEDPRRRRSSKVYLSYNINGDWIGVPGQMRSIFQLTANLVSVLAPGGRPIEDVLTSNMNENLVVQFGASRGAIGQDVTRLGIEGISGGELNTAPFEVVDGIPDLFAHLGEGSLPFTAQGIMEGEQAFTSAMAFQGARTSPQTPGEKRDVMEKEAYRKLVAQGDIPSDLSFKEAQNDPRYNRMIQRDPNVEEVREENRQLMLENRQIVAQYLEQRDAINEEADNRINSEAERLGVGAEFRRQLSNITDDRLQALDTLEKDQNFSEAVEFLEGFPDPDSEFARDLQTYREALETDPPLEDPVSEEFDFRRFEEIRNGLISSLGEDRVREIEDFTFNAPDKTELQKQLRASRDLIGDSGYWDADRLAAQELRDSFGIDNAVELLEQWKDQPTGPKREAFAERNIDMQLILALRDQIREIILQQNEAVERHLRAWGYLGVTIEPQNAKNPDVALQLQILRLMQGGTVTDPSPLLEQDLQTMLNNLSDEDLARIQREIGRTGVVQPSGGR